MYHNISKIRWDSECTDDTRWKGIVIPEPHETDLTPKEFGLLELLVRRQGEVLPRSLIASLVWDMNFDSDTNVIEVAMRRLRAKVDEGFEVRLIQTVRGMGYVLEPNRAA